MDESYMSKPKKQSLQSQHQLSSALMSNTTIDRKHQQQQQQKQKHQLSVTTANGFGPGDKLRRSSVGTSNSSDGNPETSGMEKTPVGRFVDLRSSRQEQKGREDSKRGNSLPRFNYDLVDNPKRKEDLVDQPKRKDSINTAFAQLGKGIWNLGGEVIELKKASTRRISPQPLSPRKASLQPGIAVHNEIRRKSMPSNLYSKSEPIPNNGKKKMVKGNDKKKKNRKSKSTTDQNEEKKSDYSIREEETVNVTFSLRTEEEDESDKQNGSVTDSAEVKNEMALKSHRKSYESIDIACTLTIEHPHSQRIKAKRIGGMCGPLLPH